METKEKKKKVFKSLEDFKRTYFPKAYEEELKGNGRENGSLVILPKGKPFMII